MKGNRQEKILKIIENQIILTQEDLQNALLAEGYDVTQSTISRDIKQLRLIKGHDALGNYRYVCADAPQPEQQSVAHYHNIFANSVISVEYALNDIVIKCYNGMASSVCVAVDTLFSGKMLGTIAGDDTILIITRSIEDAKSLTSELKKMM